MSPKGKVKNTSEKKGQMAREKHHWDQILSDSRIIAAVREPERLRSALECPLKIVYLACGNPMNIAAMLESICAQGKLPLVNVDLLQGFSRDAHALEYLSSCGTAGIISTHHETLRAARAQELITVLRTFAIDSSAVEASLRLLAHFEPDAIEVLPAIAAPLLLNRIREAHPALYVIAGGLVNNLKQVEELVTAGIDAVSLSNPQLWVV
jgi:glycerol uptake operon antiterminator